VLEEAVNVSNQNLKAATPSSSKHAPVLRYYRADYYPTVTAGPSATRTLVSANSPTSTVLRGRLTTTSCCHSTCPIRPMSGDGCEKRLSLYREQAQASAADLATVNLSMHADLAIDYFQAAAWTLRNNY